MHQFRYRNNFYSTQCFDIAARDSSRSRCDRDVQGVHHVELTYVPMHFNAVACSKSHIFVADSAPGGGVHIHTWEGQHTQNLSHGQLGLQDHDWIWAIYYASGHYRGPEDMLQLAVGDYCSNSVYSLNAYKVSDFRAQVHTGNTCTSFQS